MSADPPANYVDGGYRDSLLNTGAERVPIMEMKGGLRVGRRRVGGDMPPALPPSDESHNVPPVAPAAPDEEPPVDFFAPDITKEEFYDSGSNMLMPYEDFIGELDKCGTLLGQLTVKCATVKEIMYKIFLYRLANMAQFGLGGEGAIGAAERPIPRDYTAEELLEILNRLRTLLGGRPAAISGDISDILTRLNGLIGLLGTISTLGGPDRTLASPALDMLAELQRLLEVLNISQQPPSTSVTDVLSILDQLRTLLSVNAPTATTPMPNVLEQLNGLLALLSSVPAASAASTPDIITPLNELLDLLKVATGTRMPPSDVAMAEELTRRLQELLALLLNIRPQAPTPTTLTGVLDTLNGLRKLLEDLPSGPPPMTSILDQLNGLLALLGSVPAAAGAAAATPEIITPLNELLDLLKVATATRTTASDAMIAEELMKQLRGLLELLLNIKPQAPTPTAFPDVLDTLSRLRDLLRTLPSSAPPMTDVLNQLNGLLVLLGTAPSGAPATPAAPTPDIITSLNGLLQLLNDASVSTLSAADATMANELYKQLQGLLTLLLSVEPRTAGTGDAGVLDTLERLSRLLQGVRTQVVTAAPASVDGVAVLEQINQLRKLLGDIQAQAVPVAATPVVAAGAQALLTQLDGLQRLVGMATVSGIKKQLAQVTDPSQVTEMLNKLEGLVKLLGRVEEVPAVTPEMTQNQIAALVRQEQNLSKQISTAEAEAKAAAAAAAAAEAAAGVFPDAGIRQSSAIRRALANITTYNLSNNMKNSIYRRYIDGRNIDNNTTQSIITRIHNNIIKMLQIKDEAFTLLNKIPSTLINDERKIKMYSEKLRLVYPNESFFTNISDTFDFIKELLAFINIQQNAINSKMFGKAKDIGNRVLNELRERVKNVVSDFTNLSKTYPKLMTDNGLGRSD